MSPQSETETRPSKNALDFLDKTKNLKRVRVRVGVRETGLETKTDLEYYNTSLITEL